MREVNDIDVNIKKNGKKYLKDVKIGVSSFKLHTLHSQIYVMHKQSFIILYYIDSHNKNHL